MGYNNKKLPRGERGLGQLSYVIIGNGIAGLSAAETIRKRDENADITIVTNEEYLTYYRVKLSHYISKTFDDEEFVVHNEKWYQDKRIKVLLKTIVEGLDVENNAITLDNGKKLTYDKLLIANGSRPFIPPVQGKYKKGVFALRSLNDLKYAKNYLSYCKDITVIGGGLLGLEAAWSIKELGKNVNVVEFFPYLLPRQLDEELSKVFTNKLEERGLRLHLGAAVEEILGNTVVEGIKMKDNNEFKTDGVLFSAGIRPNLDLVRNTNIKYDKGILVDDGMRTNIDHIFAAGDVAEVNGVVLGLWPVAVEQGKIAGENMVGGEKVYKLPQSHTFTNIGDLSVFSAGNIQDFDKTLMEEENQQEKIYKLYIKENQLTAGALIGDTSKMLKVKKAVNNRTDISHQLNKKMACKEIIESL